MPVAMLAGVAGILFVGIYAIDHLIAHPEGGKSVLRQLVDFDAETAQNALGNLAQVIAAVLGIAITVVSIVVQLAATRYTPRVTEMFFRDRTNLMVMGFFVIACIDAVWVSLAVSRNFMPVYSILVTLCIVTGSLLLLVPYFAYVFNFLDPQTVITRIRRQALRVALQHDQDLAPLQEQVITAIEQLADISINAISNKDRIIAAFAVDALKDFVVRYLPEKRRSRAEWFQLSAGVLRNPDFVAMAEGSLEDLATRRVWVEWKVLRQYQAIYTEAIAVQRDLANQVASGTRYIGEAALAAQDDRALELACKFMNTYLRVALNGRDVRTAYNVLNDYRVLAATLLRAGRNDLVDAVAAHFRYYAQTAHTMDLGFVTETTAYDLAALCELAFELKSPIHDALLRGLLEIDKPAETIAQEKSLRGVRKAQVKLATFYLTRDAEAHAREIHRDMALEQPDRLRSIRDELQSVTTKDFWEVVDRGTNFDYLEPARRDQLRVFFGWFPLIEKVA
jgi:hypothetical protein